MNELKYPTQTIYWIAYSDDKETIHYGMTEPDQVTTTGQKNFECTQKLIKRLTELGIEIKIYDNDIEILPGILTMNEITRTVYFDKEMKEIDIFTANKVELSKVKDEIITKVEDEVFTKTEDGIITKTINII